MIPKKTDRLDTRSSKLQLLDEIERLQSDLAELEDRFEVKEDRHRSLTKALRIGFWEWDEIEDCAIHYSDEVAVIFGVKPDTLFNRYRHLENFFSIIHPEDLEHYKKHTMSGSKHRYPPGEVHSFDYRLLKPNGEIRYIRELDCRVANREGIVTSSFGLVQDITEQQDAVTGLLGSEERYSSLFNQLPLGIQEEDYSSIKRAIDKLASKDVEDLRRYLETHPKILYEMVADTRITNVNERLLQIYEAKSLQEFMVAEADVDSWWDSEWVEFYAAEISGLAGPDKFYQAERIDTRIDGTYFETRTITRFVQGHEDTWRRVITIHEDITERKQHEAAIIEAKTMAESANRAKSEFLSRMSHELRTPLNAILGFSHLFEYDKNLGKTQQSNAREIYRAGQHLRTLIDEVLDLSQIESGKIELKSEAVSVEEVLTDSVTWVGALAQSRGIRIEFDSTQFNGLQIQADPIRLKQVFLNLLTNAVKYNNKNGCVSVICSNDNNRQIHIGFRDTGPGISANNLKELFKPFNRLGAENSATEGTGIGLVITKRLLGLMQGHLHVDSKPGQGSTFWVEFELLQTKRGKHAIAASTDSGASEETAITIFEEKSRILVAEDNSINRELMAAQLGVLGLTADYAENGGEALRLWKADKYQLLLTDVRMPVMDGNELVRRIRSLELETDPPVPIIAITASAMQSDIDECLEAGVNDVIVKPVEMDELQRVLGQWLVLEDSEGKNELIQTDQVEIESAEAIDLSVLRKSIGDNAELHRQLLNSYVDDLPKTLENIQNAFAWHNSTQLAEFAHKLKSSTRSLGALQMADACQVLELASRENCWPDIHATLPLVMRYATEVISFIESFGERELIQQTVEQSFEIDEDATEFSINILIVDDDYIMHRVTTLMLNDLGIKNVISALSGASALEIIQEKPDRIDVVICDLNMPEMDGVELVRHLAERNFEGALILASGEDIRIIRTVEKLAAEHDLHLLGSLEKPITPGKLGQLLDCLDQIQSEGTILLPEACSLSELKEAILKEELDTYFQPKVDLITGEVVGVEALARWHTPNKGMIGPGDFIAMAEDNDLIVDLTRVVTKAAIRHATRLKKQGFNLNVAINISVDALSSLDWPDEMATYVEASGLAPSNITLEITESRLMDHISVALDILSRLSLKRFSLSIDDFGTGYSSMEQLQRIPFSELKIDRAFVCGAAQDSSARAILESSILLAKKLDMKVVAEGVETQQDWDLMHELGCDQVQGYFVARPMPVDELVKWLDRREADKP